MASNLNESISLEQILQSLNSPLSEEQLWSLADVASRSSKRSYEADSLQTVDQDGSYLVLSTRTLHVTSSGDVRIVPCLAEEEHNLQYSPEEVKLGLDDVDAEKVLVFGLGATLFMAADYSMAEDEEPALSGDMEALIGAMTDEDADDRANFEEVLQDTTHRANNNIEGYRQCLQQLHQAACAIAKAAEINTLSSSKSPIPLPTTKTTYSADDDIHQQLMLAIKQSSTQSLRSVTQRRLTGPEPYITPHEQLLGDIRRASQADLISVRSTSSDGTSLQDIMDARTGEGGKAILPLKLDLGGDDDDLSDLLGDWDPAKQVQLAFAAEAAATPEPEDLDATVDQHDQLKTASDVEDTPTPLATPVKSVRTQPLSVPSTPFVGFDDFKHINMSLFNAEMDELQFSDPKKFQAIKACKLCASCFKAKFGVFFRCKYCEMCNRPLCSNCGQSTPLPSHMLHNDGSTPGSPMTSRKASIANRPIPTVLLCHGCRGSLGGAALASPQAK